MTFAAARLSAEIRTPCQPQYGDATVLLRILLKPRANKFALFNALVMWSGTLFGLCVSTVPVSWRTFSCESRSPETVQPVQSTTVRTYLRPAGQKSQQGHRVRNSSISYIIQSCPTISLMNAGFLVSSGVHGVTERSGYYNTCTVESVHANQIGSLQVKVPGGKVPALSPHQQSIAPHDSLTASSSDLLISQELNSRGAFQFIGD